MEDIIKEIQREIMMLKVRKYVSTYTPEDSTQSILIGNNAGLNNTGTNNVCIGDGSLGSANNGNCNTAVGNSTLTLNTSGSQNCALGQSALLFNRTGGNNIAVGYFSLRSNQTSDNTAIGTNSLQSNVDGFQNTAVGSQTILSDSSGNNNTVMGYESGKFLSSDPNSQVYSEKNTALGSQSLKSCLYGSNLTCLGYETDVAEQYSSAWLTNSTAIGNGAKITQSNQIVLGNSDIMQLTCTVNLSTISDARFKENVKSDVPGISFISKLKPVTYNFIGKNELKTGLIAQDVEAVLNGYDFDGLIKPQNQNDHYLLSYTSFIVPLIKAVQEQQSTIEELKQEIRYLKSELHIL